ncbi:MAG: Sll0314/Alr1548 family TPR repeat-containing protein [Cyanobacteria bacterium J06627_8]
MKSLTIPSIATIIVDKATSIQRMCMCVVGGAAIATTLFNAPALADPFRTTNARSFDGQLEAAFAEMFRNGDYVAAKALLETASTDDPMTHAMQAAFAYLESDWSVLGTEAEETLTAAQQLVDSDPLRGNLYTAVGHFMEGAHVLSTQSTVQATPIVLNKLRLVFDHLRQAEEIDAQDPELNLIKGYMDLMLAVNLPFSSPDQAIDRLQAYGAPSYLVQRGVAIAYRDLDNYDAALAAVEQALEETPDNPDLFYLRAQILRLNGRLGQSVRQFDQTLEQIENYPTPLAVQIAYERCRARNALRERNESGGLTRNCRTWAQQRIARDSQPADDAQPTEEADASSENVSENATSDSTDS